MAATRVYGGVPAEQRVAERRRRLMDAALELIGTDGWSATTVRGVCERARVGPRFFYESFEDLDALAVAVLDEIVGEAMARVAQAMADAPDELSAQTRAAVETLIGTLVDDPRRARFLFAEAFGSEALMTRRFAAVRSIAALVVEHARRWLDPPRGSKRFLEASALVITGGIAEMVLVWLDDGLDITRDELVDVSIELLMATGAAVPALSRRR